MLYLAYLKSIFYSSRTECTTNFVAGKTAAYLEFQGNFFLFFNTFVINCTKVKNNRISYLMVGEYAVFVKQFNLKRVVFVKVVILK